MLLEEIAKTAVVWQLSLSWDGTCRWCYRSRKIHTVPFFLWESIGRCDKRGTKQCSHCRQTAWRKIKLLQLLCPYVQPYSHSKCFAQSSVQPFWSAGCLQLMHWFEQLTGGYSTPATNCSTSTASSLHAEACRYPFREQNTTRSNVFQTRQDILPAHQVLISLVTFGKVFFFFKLLVPFAARSIRQVILFLIACVKNPFSGDGFGLYWN